MWMDVSIHFCNPEARFVVEVNFSDFGETGFTSDPKPGFQSQADNVKKPAHLRENMHFQL